MGVAILYLWMATAGNVDIMSYGWVWSGEFSSMDRCKTAADDFLNESRQRYRCVPK